MRPTDLNVKQCKKRYAIFKAHYGTLLRLKQFFPFHLIDAVGTLDDTRKQILRELRYQSSTDLEAVTYAGIRHLPMAKELAKLSRQQLTSRLDTWALSHSELFQKVIQIIDDHVLPILRRSGMAGEATFVTRNSIFWTRPSTVDILTDVLSDRGYHVSYRPQIVQLPVRVNLQTGEIEHQQMVTHFFKIKFAVTSVRDLGEADIPSSDLLGGTGLGEGDIGSSFMPAGTDHQEKYKGNSAREKLVAECMTRDLEYHQEGLADLSVSEEDDVDDPETTETNVFLKPTLSSKDFNK